MDGSTPGAEAAPRAHPGTVREVFALFLGLGLTSFGGPVAHLAYFRRAVVERRTWLDDRSYSDLVAICQFLPGPASSQVGMAIGLGRAGIPGLFAAWVAFTLPSAVVMVAFAYGIVGLGDVSEAGWIQGLMAAAVGIVAHAVWAMARSLTPDAKRVAMAVAAAILVLLIPSSLGQVIALAAAGVSGLLWLRPTMAEGDGALSFSVRVPRAVAVACLSVHAILFLGLPVLVTLTGSSALRLFEIFYRAGALVFGGGHVVLPLLQAETAAIGLVSDETFLAGYGAAQAVPGPLFTFAAFLGAASTTEPSGILGATIALVGIFLPGSLLVVGVLPFWDILRRSSAFRRALMGVNAGVVGILAAALYSPVFTDGVTSLASLVIAAGALLATAVWRVPSWAIVIACALAGWAVL